MFTLDISHINVEEFSPEAKRFNLNALRGKEGYIHEPRGSLAWKEYWDEQEYYCKNGYSVGGVEITGEHYFYLNFCQIHLKEELKKGEKIAQFIMDPHNSQYYINQVEKIDTNTDRGEKGFGSTGTL